MTKALVNPNSPKAKIANLEQQVAQLKLQLAEQQKQIAAIQQSLTKK